MKVKLNDWNKNKNQVRHCHTEKRQLINPVKREKQIKQKKARNKHTSQIQSCTPINIITINTLSMCICLDAIIYHLHLAPSIVLLYGSCICFYLYTYMPYGMNSINIHLKSSKMLKATKSIGFFAASFLFLSIEA